jgi:hypothetical protein
MLVAIRANHLGLACRGPAGFRRDAGAGTKHRYQAGRQQARAVQDYRHS